MLMEKIGAGLAAIAAQTESENNPLPAEASAGLNVRWTD